MSPASCKRRYQEALSPLLSSRLLLKKRETGLVSLLEVWGTAGLLDGHSLP